MSTAAVYDSLKEDVLVNGGERVIKLSLSRLAKNNDRFISVIQNMVIKNTEIAVRGSIIINYVVTSSIEQNIPPTFQLLQTNVFEACVQLGPSSSPNHQPTTASCSRRNWQHSG